MYKKRYCTTRHIGVVSVGIGVSTKLNFYVKVFYVMGKSLSDELSCTRTGVVRQKNVFKPKLKFVN